MIAQKTVHQIPNIDSAIIEFAFTGNILPVGALFLRFDIGNLRKPRDDAISVHIPKTAVYFMLRIHFRNNFVIVRGQFGQFSDIGRDFRILIFHMTTLLFLLIFYI